MPRSVTLLAAAGDRALAATDPMGALDANACRFAE
jgi:hypothetical protein